MTRRLLHPMIVAALCAATLAACTEEVASGRTELAETSVRRPASSEPEATPRRDGRYSTHLYSERDADVYSRLGRDGAGGGVPVDSVVAEVGDRVAAGQVLAVLEDDEARLAVSAARPAYRGAAAEHARLETLHAEDAASAAELEQARFEMERRKAALDRALLTLRRTRVRAPFAGVVSRRYVQPGKRVTGDTPVFRVTSLSPLRARLLVPEGEMEGVRPGAPASVRGMKGDTAAARVVTVAPTLDPASGTREVVVELTNARRFPPGASVTVELGVDVPASADGAPAGSGGATGGGETARSAGRDADDRAAGGDARAPARGRAAGGSGPEAGGGR